MRNLIGILALALSLMPSAMFAQVSNNNDSDIAGWIFLFADKHS